MGKSKLSKFSELQTFDNVIQAPVRGPVFPDFPLKGKWSSDFFRNDHVITLELGCGKGEYTVGLAERHPEKNFIGVDIKGARIWSGAKSALEKNLKNVAFLRTRIEMIESFFGNDEIDEIWLTFPDPRMEKTRKRLTSANFMAKYRRILSKEGVIRLKTDSNFLFSYTCTLVEKNKLPVYCKTDNLYSSDFLDEDLSIETYYEKQWTERGMEIRYIAFGPGRNVPLEEPECDFTKDNYRSFGRNTNVGLLK